MASCAKRYPRVCCSYSFRFPREMSKYTRDIDGCGLHEKNEDDRSLEMGQDPWKVGVRNRERYKGSCNAFPSGTGHMDKVYHRPNDGAATTHERISQDQSTLRDQCRSPNTQGRIHPRDALTTIGRRIGQVGWNGDGFSSVVLFSNGGRSVGTSFGNVDTRSLHRRLYC